MSEPAFPDLNLFIACRTESGPAGLGHAARSNGRWTVRSLDAVQDLAALASHPRQPVVYGLAGLGRGRLLVWEVEGVGSDVEVSRVADLDCLGDIPCDLAVDPSGRLLVAANYGFESGTGGSLTVWRLDERGRPVDAGVAMRLEGAAGEPARQSVPHPHQVVFLGGLLLVPDLGADRIRRYRLDTDGSELAELASVPTPAGLGPRHLVVLDDDRERPRVAVSGELSGDVAVGRLDPGDPAWRTVRGTGRTGPAATRSTRNYPGDIKASPDRSTVYFANRGYDTVSAIRVDGEKPKLVREIDTAAWPQHLLAGPDEVIVACWDGGRIQRLPLNGTVPASAETVVVAPGAAWLVLGS